LTRTDGPSHSGTDTTCPDGLRTSTAFVATTVTGTNAGDAVRAVHAPPSEFSAPEIEDGLD
jgi:hypothetical protein